GRIDRIGSEFNIIYGLNFLPETALESELGIQAILKARIQEIHDVIGEDAAILDKSERINENSIYAIYERGEVAEPDEDEENMVDLNEAEEFFRAMARDNPEEYDRIRNLRDGIRAARKDSSGRIYVFCRAGNYNKLHLAEPDGRIVSTEIPSILNAILATREVERAHKLPRGFNESIMRIKASFAEEMKHLEAQRDHVVRQTLPQRYVIRELRVMFSQTTDDEQKAQINEMERAFRMSPTRAVSKDLISLRRNGEIGESLLKKLINIYHAHRLGDRIDQAVIRKNKDDAPRIVCSEAL
ncbi:MAG TPA: helicase, partial [Candidatus Sumerlaeota bacterium]|nr:helicase [Candidatus Sumerlaeota bacterium]